MLKYHIQTIEVGSGGASSISFSSIPQTYDDLLLITSLRDNVASGGWENAFIYPNNSSSNMASRFLYGFSTTTGSGINNPAVIYHQTARGNNTANTFSNSSVFFSGYTSSSNKAISSDTSVERNDASAINAITTALWSSSAPITSLSIVAASGSFVQYSSAALYGIKRGSDGRTEVVATGGTITTSGGFTIHTFTGSGTFVANRSMQVETLVIAGGGGGGDDVGGGGGGGGYRTTTELSLAASTSYPVVVGAGGVRGAYSGATQGGESSFAGIISAGGGRGAGYANAAGAGGSGGGGGSGAAGGAGNTPATTPSQGNNGASGAYINGPGAGGGGAGSAGSGVNGGAGASSSITGTAVTRAGGGAGGSGTSGEPGGTGGSGGGGNPGVAGTANTGGGGGGGNFTANAANGGSGVVIIRYLTPA